MNITISITTIDSEVESTFRLATQVFSNRANMDKTTFRKLKELDWSGFGFFKKDDIIVVKDSDAIIGTIRLVYRIVYIENQSYKTAGFTDVCISDKYRGKGISKKIMKYAINVASCSCEIGLLFASKNVDYYYNKFGFWGLSTYNKIIIKNTPHNSTISFKTVASKDLEYCDYLYEQNYSNLNGFMTRTPRYWKYVLERCQQLKMKFKAIFQNNKLCGYCIYKENIIYEISFNSCINIKDILSKFESDVDIQIEIDPQHIIAKQLQLFDFTMHHRNCFFGGHMLKVLNNQDNLNLQGVRNFFKINNKTVNFSMFNQF